MMKLIHGDIDVNLLFANLETLKDYLKDIYVCYESVLKSKKNVLWQIVMVTMT